MDHAGLSEKAGRIAHNVGRALSGKRGEVLLTLAALLAGGHVLLEDVPGVGKTLLARSLARSVSGEFRRIQFTADLMPADVTGLSVYDGNRGGFEFLPVGLHLPVHSPTPFDASLTKNVGNRFEIPEERRRLTQCPGVNRLCIPLPGPRRVIRSGWRRGEDWHRARRWKRRTADAGTMEQEEQTDVARRRGTDERARRTGNV